MTTSEITIGFSGPDGVNLFRAKRLLSSIKMMHETQGRLIPTPGMTMTKALKIATGYTKQAYKRTEAVKAMGDLKMWISAMECAIPVENMR